MGRPSRPKFGLLGHVKTGKSGVAVVVTGTTPSPGVTVPVVVPVCGTVVVVGPAVVAKVFRKKKIKRTKKTVGER